MSQMTRGLASAFVVALFLISCGVARAAHVTAASLKAGLFEPPREAPEFSLVSSNNGALHIGAFRGKVVLLAFGYTSCTAVCPITLNTFAVARHMLGAAAADVQVVYITVDPGRDDPARLKGYLGAFDHTFVGGTGTEQQLAAVRKSYGVSAEKQVLGDSYAYEHSSFTYLIDRGGRIRALMPYGHSPADYVHDLTLLLKE